MRSRKERVVCPTREVRDLAASLTERYRGLSISVEEDVENHARSYVVIEGRPTHVAYAVHFYDGWVGRAKIA